ncbi:BlaI/MecI/CopY family transcriptional regulator [Lentisphaera araneosa]|nr:BlaI/MecI/CopY family transcriptional regulator [Lentisphaera araneosa]
MDKKNLSESEWTVMEVLWEQSPQTAKDVKIALEEPKQWAINTVRTLLTRLVNKGALETADNQSGVTTFKPLISHENCIRAESQSFLKRIFGGSSMPLLVHFSQNADLSEDDVEELKKILDESVKNKQVNKDK